VAGSQLSDVCSLNAPRILPAHLEVSRRSLGSLLISSGSFLLYLNPPPSLSPPPPPPPLPLPLPHPPLPLLSKFDVIGSGPCREFSVRATALLNMASDGMILTNHDHQIRVGVLTGKCRNAYRIFHSSLIFQWIYFRRLSVRIFIDVGWFLRGSGGSWSLAGFCNPL